MNNRERVFATLTHQQPDKIPYQVGFTQRAHTKMVEFYGDPDFASKLGREFVKPRIEQMYALTKSKGKFVFIHSCGKVDAIFPDLIEYGVDVFNPFQPEVVDVFDIKNQYGDNLSFYGGISTQRTLPYGTVEQVRNEVERLLEVVGRNGGYIAAPAHAIPGDAKPENVAAMIEVLQNQ